MDFLDTDSDKNGCSARFATGFVTNMERSFSPTYHRFSINKMILIIYIAFPRYFKAVNTKNLKMSKWWLLCFLLLFTALESTDDICLTASQYRTKCHQQYSSPCRLACVQSRRISSLYSSYSDAWTIALSDKLSY